MEADLPQGPWGRHSIRGGRCRPEPVQWKPQLSWRVGWSQEMTRPRVMDEFTSQNLNYPSCKTEMLTAI